MIVSKDADKAFAKIQYAFIITVPWTAGQEGTFLNTIKTTCEKLTISIILNGGKLKQSKEVMTLSFSMLCSKSCCLLTGAISKDKKIKGRQIEK